MEQLIDIFRFFSISQLLVLIALLLYSEGRKLDIYVSLFFLFCIISYLLADWVVLHHSFFFYISLIGAFALPFSFWVFSKILFDDDFVWKKWLTLLLISLLILNYGIFLQHRFDIFPQLSQHSIILQLLHQILSLLFIILSIIEATRSRQIDLIESRIGFRKWYILITAILISLTILTEIASFKEKAPLILELLQKATIAGLTFYFIVHQSKLKTGFLRKQEKSLPNEKDHPQIDRQLNEKLTEWMEIKKVYRKEGLTIRQLSEEMNEKEYKLRQLINLHLGFRNFNEFINSYRIREACQLLLLPERKDYTVLEIAYEMGYQSLAPFNKAFKTQTGMTPTEWRNTRQKNNF